MELMIGDIVGLAILCMFAGAIAGGLAVVKAYERFGKFSKKEGDD